MTTKKKTPGRPKSRRMVAAENKIKKLEKQLEEIQNSGIAEVDINTLTHDSVTIVKNENGRYELLLFRVSPSTGIGKLAERRDAGDAEHRARFELNKFLSLEFKIK